MEKLPSLSAVAVPKIIGPLKRVTVEPGSAVPVIVGVESFVTEEIEARAEGATGGVVSIANAVDLISVKRIANCLNSGEALSP